MIDGLEQSVRTILLLIPRERIRDMYAIGRMVYETAVNAAFILAKGDTAAERAWRHAQQKRLRDLKRSVKFGDEVIRLEYSGANRVLNTPECQKLLAEFTLKDGREDRNWTPENIAARLGAIRARFERKNSVGLAYGQLLYRHASEMLHGTLFSAVFAYGAAEPSGPPKSVRQMRVFREEQMRLVLLLVSTTLHSFILIFAKDIGQENLAKRAESIYDGG